MVILGRGLDGLNLDTDSLIVGVAGLLDEITVGTLNQVLTVTAGGVDWAPSAATGLQNIVEDTTPQLGGQLDAQSVKIVNLGDPTANQDAATKFYVDQEIAGIPPFVSQSIGDLSDVDLTGLANADVLVFNTIAGEWQPQAGGGGGGINNVVEDLTPQLGGSLDAQGAFKVFNLIDPTLNQDAATKFYVDTTVAAVVASAPLLLDTLNELAAALGDDPNFSTTVLTLIGEKVSKAGDTMTGALILSGAPTIDLHAATKKYVDDNVGEVNTMSNLAGGTGVFKVKNGVDFEMRSLLGTGGTTVSLNLDVIEIDSTDGTLTQVNSGVGLSGGPITTTGTLDLDINSLPLDAGIDGASDFLAYHDASTGLVKKVLINSIGVGDMLAVNNLSELTGTQITARSNIGAASATDLSNHTSNTSNPHAVTAAQTGAVAKIGDTMSGALQFNAGASLTSDTGVELSITAGTGAKTNIEGNSIEIQGNSGAGGQLFLNADGSIQLRPAIGFPLTLGDDIDLPFSIGTANQILQVNAGGTALEFANNAGAGVNTLNDLSDTTITAPGAGDVLRYSGAVWVNATLAHADLSGIGTNTHAQIDSHISDTSNPHSVTAVQVGALTAVVDDLSPQLGGDLDIQARVINTSTVNGDIQVVPNGTGKFIVGNVAANAVITSDDAAVSSNASGFNLTIQSGIGDGLGDGGNIIITPGVGGESGTDGVISLDGLIWPLADGTVGQVIITDGSGNLSFGAGAGAGDPDQNLWETITSDSGSAVANTITDTLTVAGGTNVTTAIVGDTLTINTSAEVNQNAWSSFSLSGNTAGDATVSASTKTDTVTFVGGLNITLTGNDTTDTITIDADGGASAQNLWETINADSATTTTANTTTDTLTLTGGSGITTNIVGDVVTFTNDSPNVDQSIWLTISSDSGSVAANTTNDTLTVSGGTGISTGISLDTLTITNTAPNVDQNLWATFNADGATSTIADTTSDALTITGGTGITTGIAADTLTITNDAPNVVQNVWLTVAGDTGSTAANVANDLLTIAGGASITTVMSADTLTITNDAPNVDQNLFSTIAVATQTNIVADTTSDTLTFAAGTGVAITTNAGTDTITITNSSPNVDQNLFLNVASDSGTAVADTITDTLTISGGTNIATAVVGDTLTINMTGTLGDLDQNLWATFNADGATSTTANTITDSFTITGGTGITTGIVGDVLTITNDSPNVDQNLFSTIAVATQSNVVADTTSDTLTFVAGTNMTITTDAGTDTVTFTASGGGGSSISVEDEGTPLTAGVTKFNFVGAGVTVTEPVTDEMLVTITGAVAGPTEERFRLNYDTTGAMVSTTELSAGVSVAIIAGSEVNITFTGHARPPSSILIYGYAHVPNEYLIKVIDANVLISKIAAGGVSGTPTAFGAFSGPMSLTLTEGVTGASRGFGTTTHTYIMFIFGD